MHAWVDKGVFAPEVANAPPGFTGAHREIGWPAAHTLPCSPRVWHRMHRPRPPHGRCLAASGPVPTRPPARPLARRLPIPRTPSQANLPTPSNTQVTRVFTRACAVCHVGAQAFQAAGNTIMGGRTIPVTDCSKDCCLEVRASRCARPVPPYATVRVLVTVLPEGVGLAKWTFAYRHHPCQRAILNARPGASPNDSRNLRDCCPSCCPCHSSPTIPDYRALVP